MSAPRENDKGASNYGRLKTLAINHGYLVTMFNVGIASSVMQSVTNQYLYRRVAASYTDDLTSLANVTAADPCSTSEVNTSSPEYQLSAEISAATSRWSMYLLMTSYLPPLFTLLFLGAYSDQAGRRFLCLLPLGVSVLNGSIICLVIWLKLHLAFLLLAQFIFGVAGGGSTLGIAVFSYSSDQHTKQLDTAETEAEGVKSTRTSISTVDSELRPERVPQSNESVEYQPADETHQYTETNVIDDSAPTSVAALGFGPAPEEASQSYESYGHRPTNQKQEKKAVESTTKRERDDGERSDGKNSNSKKPIAAPLLDKNRALRILIIECVSIVGRGCAQLTNGYFISFAGFFYPTLSATLFFAVTLIWTYFTIQTPKNPPKKTSIGQSIVQPLKTMFRAIRQPRRLSAFVLCNLGMMLIVFADGGNNRTLPIYQMSPPFCWTSVEIGWFESEFTFVLLLSIPLLYVLKRFRLSEPVMAGIGITFNVFGTLMYAIINGADWVFYVGAVLISPGMLPYALTRSITSRLAGPEAHGAMFAVSMWLELATYMVGGLSGSGMYQTTVAKLHSAVFFFYAALYATSALVYYMEGIVERKFPPLQPVEVTVNSTDKEKANHERRRT